MRARPRPLTYEEWEDLYPWVPVEDGWELVSGRCPAYHTPEHTTDVTFLCGACGYCYHHCSAREYVPYVGRGREGTPRETERDYCVDH